MLRRSLIFLGFCALAAAAPRGCVGGVAVTTFRLTAAPAGGNSASYLAIRRLNNIPNGYRVRYQPQDLPADLRKDAKLTLVMVPKAADGPITVLEPRAASGATEWPAPLAPQILLLVFAPQGLDEKRLTNLVTRDGNMASALADYADQTADLEAGLDALSALDDEADEDSVKPLRGSTPMEQALFALVRALNPAVSAYNPLGAGRRAGPATLMGKGADAFFENAGGFVPGGGILPGVKSWLMPDTEFRSVYGLPGDSEAMTLCAQLQARTRNKIAYIWAYRLTGAAMPAAAIARPAADIPMGIRAGVPLKLDKAADWRLLSRVYDWTLIAENGTIPPLRVPARAMEDERSLQLDLRKFPGAPGAYRIEGQWDWSTLKVSGSVQLHRLEDLKAARLTPESQDRLIAGSGPVAVDLTGADFLFVEKATLHRPSSTRQIPVDLPPERTPPANQLRIEVDTDGLRPGPYLLALSRVDGAVAEVPVQLLPPPPKLNGSAPRLNMGEREQTVTLTGTGLDRIKSIECDQADVVLGPAAGDGTRLEVTVRLRPAAKAGDRLALGARIEGMTQAIRFPAALQVIAARPRILDAKASLPADLGIAPRDGELPAGSWVSFAMRMEPPDLQPEVTIQCAEAARTVQPETVHAGEKRASAQFAPAGGGAWFLSFDPGAVGQSGCTLTAVVGTEESGKSDPFSLGRVVRLPRVESFVLTDEKSPDGFFGALKGFDLEIIEKTGWDARTGVAVADLPRPVAGEGARQTLRVAMPWPSPTPKAPLYIWLRGESEGRATKVTQ